MWIYWQLKGTHISRGAKNVYVHTVFMQHVFFLQMFQSKSKQMNFNLNLNKPKAV